jgi:protein-ribulosamine 3-kinase
MTENLKKHLESILQEKITVFPAYSGKVITTSGKTFFLKSGNKSATYGCEARGLKELKRTKAVEIVLSVAYGENFILTEYVLQGNTSANIFENFGRNFAQMHQYTCKEYGFYEDNFIGATEQINIADESEKHDWTAFYFNKRLLYQYQLAEKNSLVSDDLRRNFSTLENKIASILADSEEPPTLLHGDLWSGNFLCNENGEAVLIDPAVYYGHREADLAMTKLFGGFAPAFYQAYQQAYPLSPGWEYREDIYKLYHVLNHLNIFGRGYLSEAERIVRKYAK